MQWENYSMQTVYCICTDLWASDTVASMLISCGSIIRRVPTTTISRLVHSAHQQVSKQSNPVCHQYGITFACIVFITTAKEVMSMRLRYPGPTWPDPDMLTIWPMTHDPLSALVMSNAQLKDNDIWRSWHAGGTSVNLCATVKWCKMKSGVQCHLQHRPLPCWQCMSCDQKTKNLKSLWYETV